ncbi:MAG: DUF4129 domain-containing protein [Terriglobales bacterium]
MNRALQVAAVVLISAAVALGAETAAAAPSPAPRPVNLAEYRAELRAIAGRLQRLKEHTEEAAALRESLPEKYNVDGGNRHLIVDLAPLKTSLERFSRASEPHQQQLRESMQSNVAAMLRGVDEYTQTSDATAARARLQEILARREFAQVRGKTLLEIWRERISAWILRVLDRIFGKVRGSERGNKFLLWTLIAITAVVLVIWIKRMARRREVEVVRGPVPFAPSGRHWRAWLADARAAAERGRWRDAIHFAYWAAISHLEDSGAWVPDRARTPREYLRLISPRNSGKAALDDLTRSFERTWYGQQSAGAEDYQAALRQVEGLGCR